MNSNPPSEQMPVPSVHYLCTLAALAAATEYEPERGLYYIDGPEGNLARQRLDMQRDSILTLYGAGFYQSLVACAAEDLVKFRKELRDVTWEEFDV